MKKLSLLTLVAGLCVAPILAQGVWGFRSAHSISVTPEGRVDGRPLKPDNSVIPLEQPLPVYPFEMMRQGYSGEVRAKLLVAKDGSVSEAELISSTKKEFEEPAIRAMKQWRFRAYLEQKSIEPDLWVVFRIRFTLLDE